VVTRLKQMAIGGDSSGTSVWCGAKNIEDSKL